jgi:hypothetical protein
VGPLGRTVVVPVANPASVRPLLVCAAQVAAADGGTVVPITVVAPDADEDRRREAAAGVAEAEATARAHGVDARGAVVEAPDPAAGTLQAVHDHDATLVVMGWRGRSSISNVFGRLIDSLVGRSSVPLAVVRLGSEPHRRVLLPVGADHLLPGGGRGLTLAAELTRRLGAAADEPTTVLRTGSSEVALPRAVAALGDRVHHDPRRIDRAVAAIARPDDLVVAAVPPTVSGLRSATTHLAWAAPGATLLVAVDVGPTGEPPVSGHDLVEATSDAAIPAPARRHGHERQVRLIVTVRLPDASRGAGDRTGGATGASPNDLDRVLRRAGDTDHLMVWWPAGDDRAHVRVDVTVLATSDDAAIRTLVAAVHDDPAFRGAEITYDVDRAARG